MLLFVMCIYNAGYELYNLHMYVCHLLHVHVYLQPFQSWKMGKDRDKTVCI